MSEFIDLESAVNIRLRHFKINRYSAELKRTDSSTYPIVGEFACVIGDSNLVIRFAWKDGRWVDRDGGYQLPANLAQQ